MDYNFGRGRSRGRGRQNDFVPVLRRPHHIPQQVMIGHDGLPHGMNAYVDEDQTILQRLSIVDNQEKNSFPKEMKKSTLSADAAEFVPRSFVPRQNIVYQEQKDHQAMAYHQNIPPSEFMTDSVIQEPDVDLMGHPTVIEMNNLVVDLSLSPDRFHIISSKASDLLNKVTDINLMKELITVIFEQGQGEPNFRYNGAKLCAVLSNSVERVFYQKNFKILLLERLNQEFTISVYLLYNDPKRFRGYLMFLAEIFIQILSSQQKPLDVIGNSLYELLMLIFQYEKCNDNENVSSIIKVLKIAGSSLDQVNSSQMDKLMGHIRELLAKNTLKESLKNQVVSLIELRAGNWGKSSTPSIENEPKPSTIPSSQSCIPVFETVYYGPNGVVEKHDENFDDSQCELDDNCSTAELDDEAAAAFEEFLKTQQ